MTDERTAYLTKSHAWLALRGVPALSVTQPWASLLIHGEKRIETRSWRTTYHGPVLIHASKEWDFNDFSLLTLGVFRTALNPHGIVVPQDVPRGAALGFAWLVGCQPMRVAPDAREEAFGFFGPGRIGWRFTDPAPFATPVTLRGARGLWHCFDPVLIDRAVAYAARRYDALHHPDAVTLRPQYTEHQTEHHTEENDPT